MKSFYSLNKLNNFRKKLTVTILSAVMALSFIALILINGNFFGVLGVSYKIQNFSALKSELSTLGITIDEGNTGDYHNFTSLDISDNTTAKNALIILSQTTPLYYSELTSIQITDSNIELSTAYNSAVHGSMTFQGLGSAEYPFKAQLKKQMDDGLTSSLTLFLNTSLFNVLSTDSRIAPLKLHYQKANGQDSVFATTVVQGVTNTLNRWSVTSYYSDTNGYVTSGGIIDTISENASVDLDVTYFDESEQNLANEYTVKTSSNAGLICNTMESGASLKISGYSHTHNVGAITIANPLYKAKIQSNGGGTSGSAGMLVGKADSNCAIILANGWNHEFNYKYSIYGGYAGGLVGSADNLDLQCLNNSKIVLSKKVYVDSKMPSGCAGGLVGKLIVSKTMTFCNDFEYDCDRVLGEESAASWATAYGVLSIEDTLNSEGYVGGVFGIVELSDNANLTVGKEINEINTEQNVIRVSMSGHKNHTMIGGVIGYAYSSATGSANPRLNVLGLNCQFMTINTGNTGANSLGGIVGQVGSGTNGVYCNVEDCAVETFTLWAQNDSFGGVSAKVMQNSIVRVEDFMMHSKRDPWINGSGIVNKVYDNAVVCLAGTIDLTNTYYTTTATAQLIGEQNCSLVYAEQGISLFRGKNGKESVKTTAGNASLNDIGNYGTVILLGNNIVDANGEHPGLDSQLFTIDENNKFKLKSDYLLTINANKIVLSSPEAFALLAVTIQSQAKIQGIVDCPTETEILQKSIELSTDIDMTGTGIYGLQRDMFYYNDASLPFKNQPANGITFDGNNHTLTLTAGYPWGTVTTSVPMLGDGKIKCGKPSNMYSAYNTVDVHNTIGLYRNGGNITFRDLTVAGRTLTNIWNTNTGDGLINISAILGISWGNVTFDNVKVTSKFETYCDSVQKMACYGGFIGKDLEGNTLTVNNCEYSGEIDVQQCKNDYVKAGAIAGMLAGASNSDNGFSTVNISGFVMKGNLSYKWGSGAACMGLLISTIGNRRNTRTLNITDSYVVGSKITCYNLNNCGGFLGYCWENTDVNLGDGVANGITITNVKDSVTYAIPQIETNNNADVGGLCYSATGHWSVYSNGINFNKTRVNNRDGKLGLIICNAKPMNSRALYLELLSSDSYNITSSSDVVIAKTANRNFDEIVYVTCSNDNIFGNGQSVISIATVGNALIDTSAANCNTYVNRTKYSGATEWTNNGYSRYYYNLHAYREAPSDNAQRLLIFSVKRYAHWSISSYFNNVYIYSVTGEVNLSGYSYYPINLDSAITLNSNVTVIFDNETIEQAEQTVGSRRTTRSTSQHYMMHGGLFNDVSSPLSVSNLTLKGSVAYDSVNAKSGALVCGEVKTGAENSKNRLTLNNIVLNDLYAYGYVNGVAPLLVNKVGGYADVSINGLRTASDSVYTDETSTASWYAGSSLMGDVGSSTAIGIVLSFEDIRLDSRTSVGALIPSYATRRTIFKNATLLQTFRYATDSSGSYKFRQEEDWNGSSHIQQVTYGKEISDSVRNPDGQYMYFDTENNVGVIITDVAYTGNNEHYFSIGYLPYVCISHEYDSDIDLRTYHELDVNLKIYHLLTGCGTYGDPYEITMGGQFATIREFFITGLQAGFVVNYSDSNKNLNSAHNQSNASVTHRLFIYSNVAGMWVEAEENGNNYVEKADSTAQPLENSVILEHLQTAYYKVDTDITLGTSFNGLGTTTNPFCGVIVGNGTSVISLKSASATGFISVGKGCVLKDLIISYEPMGSTIVINNTDSTAYSNLSYYGGVIGLIYGGDNVIDGVTVNGTSISLTGNRNYLTNVGGFVGGILRGGLILRNVVTPLGFTLSAEIGMPTPSFGETNFSYLYCNQYVGRVYEGYAFAETGSALNTNKHYLIPVLDKNVLTKLAFNTTGGVTVTIPNAQALYVLSALVSSDALCKENANYTGYGSVYRARGLADYSGIGTESSDYTLANKDDKASSVSYLLKKYCDLVESGYATVSTMVSNGATAYLSFTGDIDISGYKSAFRGIGYRYLTANNVNLNIYGANALNGNSHTVELDTSLKEYQDDNYMSVGFGLFNRLNFNAYNNSTIKDLTVKGSVSATHYNSAGESVILGDFSGVVRHLAVGGLIGSILGGLATVQNVNVGKKISSSADTLTVCGGKNTGGIIGITNGGTLNVIDSNCSGVEVRSNYTAGGFIGLTNSNVNITYTVNKEITDFTVKAMIKADGFTSHVGGLVGYANLAQGALTVGRNNDDKYLTLKNYLIEIENEISGSNYEIVNLGGVIGTANRTVYAYNVKVENATVKDREFSLDSRKNVFPYSGSGSLRGKTNAGGIVGKSEDWVTLTLKNVYVDDSEIIASNSAGGIIGTILRGTINLYNSNVSTDLTNQVTVNGNVFAGGIVGYSEKGFYAENVNIGNADKDSVSVLVYSDATNFNPVNDVCVGGVLGRQNSSNTESVLTVKDAKIYTIKALGNNNVGGIVGMTVSAIGAKRTSVNLSNVYLGDSVFENASASVLANNNRTHGVGAIIGGDNRTRVEALYTTINGKNIILNNNTYTVQASNKATVGALVGVTGYNNTSWSNSFTFNILGITVHGENVPARELGLCVADRDKTDAVDGFVIYADYLGTSINGLTLNKTVENMPESGVYVYGASGTQLVGDGSYVHTVGEDVLPMSKYIWNNANTLSTDTVRNGYNSLIKDSLSNAEMLKLFTTYSAVKTNLEYDGTDFPILIVDKDKNSEVDAIIKQYLGVLTNGGAVDYLNTEIFNVDFTSYAYDGSRFVAQNDSSLEYKSDSSGHYTFRIKKGKNDSGEVRFTLMTFTFRNLNGDTFRLQVPAYVDKPVDVTVTINQVQGTVFKDDLFEDKYRVLTEYDSQTTVRIEYLYDYSWGEVLREESNIAQWYYVKDLSLFLGGSVESENALPVGTRITLIDAQDNNRAYTKIVQGAELNSLNFHTFFDGWMSKNMAELGFMDEISIDTDIDERYVVCDENDTDGSKLLVNGVYYRLEKATDGNAIQRYRLRCKEAYLLVVKIPKSVGSQIYRDVSFQPSINTRLESASGCEDPSVRGFQNNIIMDVDSRNNQLKIYADVDTEFVKIDETVNEQVITTDYVALEKQDNTISLDLQTNVTGDTRLVDDGLTKYLQYSLQLYGRNGSSLGGAGFDGLVTTEVEFKIESTKNVDGSTLNASGKYETTVSYSYDTVDGSVSPEILIPLATAYNSSPINLIYFMNRSDAEVTVYANLKVTFYQDGSMSTFPTPTLITEEGVPDSYVSFNPTMILSDNVMFSSGAEKKLPDGTKMWSYYLARQYDNSFSLNADSKEQLGINVGADGEPADENAIINATGIIDASTFGEALADYDIMECSITLSQKQNDGSYNEVGTISNYISSIGLAGENVSSGSYVWEILRGDNNFNGTYDGEADEFFIPLVLKVKRMPEDNVLAYTSYKVTMSINFYKSSDRENSKISLNKDYIVYLVAKVSTGLLK